MSMLKLENIVKTYGEGTEARTQALRGVSLEVEQGEMISVMGTSGSGKSTLLHILGAMDKATSGQYMWGDIPVHEMSMRKLHAFRRDHISFVFQQFALMSQYSIYENIELPLLIKGVGKKQRRQIINQLLEQLEISETRNKLPKNVSGGQRQRCAIARAIASGNPLVLADEPTGALDVKTGNEVMQLLKSCRENGKTIIIVTHDKNIAAQTDRILCIEDGLLV